MVKIVKKKTWSKWSIMVQNGNKKDGQPDLERAQRTGLSARRARRTKSRGPKGLQLDFYPYYFTLPAYQNFSCF